MKERFIEAVSLKKDEFITVGFLREFLEQFHEDAIVEIEVDNESDNYTIWEMSKAHRSAKEKLEGKSERYPLLSIRSNVRMREE